MFYHIRDIISCISQVEIISDETEKSDVGTPVLRSPITPAAGRRRTVSYVDWSSISNHSMNYWKSNIGLKFAYSAIFPIKSR